jgi:serine/threonine protein kinase
VGISVFSPSMQKAVRYRVLEKIAHGGMAEIFLAVQIGAEGFQKRVVLKRILPAYAADPMFVRMLLDEAHIASTLNHSNIVQVLDLGKAGEQYFLVLEYIDGWSLEAIRRRAQKAKQKMPLHLALYIVGALCRALAYAHTRQREGQPLGIVHRDVTPQNVLISREGEVKLTDFGIAKAIGRSEKSATGIIKGKFAYMSPEQSMGTELDARSDLFSVGTLLYVLTTGRKPFEAPNDVEVIQRVRKARYEKPTEILKTFNPEVERFIVRALRTDRSKRWQTAEQMADRIEAIAAKLGQASGPAALKRWLADLAERDGGDGPVREAVAAPTSTVHLGTDELELQEVDPPEPAPPPPPPRRQPSRPPSEPVRPAEKPPAALTEERAPRVVKVPRAPSVLARFGRWLRRVTIATALVLVLLGTGAYFARPYLPGWMVRPVEGWIHQLHLPLARPAPPGK